MGITDLLTSRQKLVNQWAADHYLLFGRSKPDSRTGYVLNIPITLTTVRKRRLTSMPLCRTSTGKMLRACTEYVRNRT